MLGNGMKGRNIDMAKIKVILIAEAMLGGIRQHVFDIAKGLDKKKYDVYLIYSDNRADDKFFEDVKQIGKTIHLIKCNDMQRSLGMNDIQAYQSLKKIIKEIKPDVVHCHSSKAGIVGRIAAKSCKVPMIIYTPHAYAFQIPDISKAKKMLYVCAERFLTRYACDYTINVSKGEMELALQYKIASKEHLKLIYNGIENRETRDKAELMEKLQLNPNKRYVGVTARCAKQKDPFTFLKVALKTIKSNDNVDFIYIGDGDMEDKMKSWIIENDMQDRIHMLGFRNDAPEIVGCLDIYLSTASYEGLPYSMIEAMRAGVPIIATDTVGNNELVFEGVNGMMFPIGDVDKAVELINRQLKFKIIKTEDVKNTFNSTFSLNVMMAATEKLYDGCSL
jgi:glycosyltransferase involved in cell wall biosynthesis